MTTQMYTPDEESDVERDLRSLRAADAEAHRLHAARLEAAAEPADPVEEETEE